MIPRIPRDSESDESPRDIDVELQSFMVRHGVEISVAEVFHLSPQPEIDEQIRQHNHATIRTSRAKQALVVCVTAFNWDEFPVEPQQVLFTIAGEGALLEQCEEDYFAWCEAQEFDPDRRGVERKFRQTVDATNALRRMLGETAYEELITLYLDTVPRLDEDEVGGEEEDDL